MSTRTALLALAFVVLWSSGFVGADLGTRLTGADTLLAWRMLAATVVLAALCALTGRRPSRAALRRHVPLGVAMQLGYLGGVFLGVQLGVPAATTALVAAVQPLLVALAQGRLSPGPATRLTGRRAAGLALGFAGVALVVGTGLHAGAAPAWAYALPVLAMLSLTAGTLAAGRSDDPADVVTGLTIQTATAAVGFTAWAALTGHLAPPMSGAFAGAVAWLVFLAGIGGYGTYLLLAREAGPATTSVLLYLTPPTTALWAAAMFGEPLSPVAGAGMAVSLAGVLLFLRPRRADRR